MSGRGTDRQTKAERKEEARLRRIEVQRHQARARRNRTLGIIGLAIVAVAVAVAVVATRPEGGEPSGPLPGLLTTKAPWPDNATELDARLNRLSLGPEGAALHIHPHLYIYVDGAEVQVPGKIGLTQSSAAPLHTHEADGAIHVESADPNRTFTLGEFFDVWGVRLTATCLGGYCDQGDRKVRLYVGGELYQGNPRDLALEDQQQIVLTYGTQAQVPDPLPEFDFSNFQG